MSITRRTALAGACAGGVLTACGVNRASTRGEAPAPSSGPTSKALSLSVDDIPVGGSVVVMVDRVYPVAVARPTSTTYAAHTAVCTHQHCTTRPGPDGRLDCPCHGSQFDAATGDVLAGPATRPLQAWPFTLADGTLTLHRHEDAPYSSQTPHGSSGPTTKG